jgi:hypothetical protein
MSYGKRENVIVNIPKDVKNVGSYGTLNVQLIIVLQLAISVLPRVQLI